jgi:hypothetical protein
LQRHTLRMHLSAVILAAAKNQHNALYLLVLSFRKNSPGPREETIRTTSHFHQD